MGLGVYEDNEKNYLLTPGQKSHATFQSNLQLSQRHPSHNVDLAFWFRHTEVTSHQVGHVDDKRHNDRGNADDQHGPSTEVFRMADQWIIFFGDPIG